ncbi:hypothetical protein LVJ94_28405 [Pendulispora rubella]|uniref:Lipoprotein n=1 Tax=Pendulispora rubella TaxID=2741070 RepID=A0ABZ2KQ82_9BACT
MAAMASIATGCATRSPSEDKPSLQGQWQTETVQLPVTFAPDISFHGREEVHTPAGFLDPNSERFLSYAFVWRLDGAPDLSKASLEQALTRYFVGLARSVGEGQYPIDPARIGATLAEIEGPADARPTQHVLRGKIRVLDPSRIGQYMTLHADVRASSCEGSGHPQVVVRVSPQARTHAVWTELDSLFGAFDCAPPQERAARQLRASAKDF